jgi:hypothetical protein
MLHTDFIYRLAELVEYAETNDLEVASLALTAAVEVIAPTVAQAQREKVQTRCAASAVKSPHLRLIQGGQTCRAADAVLPMHGP